MKLRIVYELKWNYEIRNYYNHGFPKPFKLQKNLPRKTLALICIYLLAIDHDQERLVKMVSFMVHIISYDSYVTYGLTLIYEP